MSLTTILTQFALTVGASLAERVASALSARIKQEPEPEANPVDIAIATKSAVSADREGKIASKRGKYTQCFHVDVTEWKSKNGWHNIGCNTCGAYWLSPSKEQASKEWLEAKMLRPHRRLGDYGPGGE